MYNSTVIGISSSARSKNHQLSDLSPSLVACINVDAEEVGLLVYLSRKNKCAVITLRTLEIVSKFSKRVGAAVVNVALGNVLLFQAWNGILVQI